MQMTTSNNNQSEMHIPAGNSNNRSKFDTTARKPTHPPPTVRLHFKGEDTNLGPQIKELAEFQGDQAQAVTELAQALARDAQAEDLIAANVDREGAMRTIRNASSRLEEAQKKRERTPQRVVQPGSSKQISGPRLVMLILALVVLAASLWVENTSSATMLIGFEVLNLTNEDMWKARIIMFTPVVASMTGAFALKIIPNMVRKVLLLIACFLLFVSSISWCVAFAHETQRYRDEALRPFSMLEESAESSPTDSDMAILLFASQALLLLLSPMLMHRAVEIMFEESQDKVLNPEWLSAESEVRIYEKDIDVAQDRLSEAERKIAILKSRETELVTSALNVYRRMKLSAVLLIAAALTFFSPNMVRAQQVPGKAELRPRNRVIAVSPGLSAADRAELKTVLVRECEVMLNLPQGHVLQMVDAWTSQSIAKVENTTNSSRTRRRDTAEQLKLMLDFLKNSGGNEPLDGRVHLPRLAHTLAQLRIPPRAHVVVIGNPLFLGSGQDALYSMVNGRYPSDGCLFDSSANVFSTVGRSKRLESQYWHLGWNTSEFTDEGQKLAVLRFWALYLNEQSASLVTGQPSVALAMDAANRSTTNKLVEDQPNRSAKPGMVSVKWVVEEETIAEPVGQEPKVETTDSIEATNEPLATDGKDAQARSTAVSLEDQVVRKPQLNLQQPEALDVTVDTNIIPRDRFRNLVGSANDLVKDRQIDGKKIAILNLYRCPELDQSPLYDALKDKGFEVERLYDPLPSAEQFTKVIEATDQLWLISSDGTSTFNNKHAEIIINRWRTGELALFILCDNDPFTYEATRLLTLMSSGQIKVTGNYLGMQYLEAGSEKYGGGFDRASPLFHNVETLFEGSSVSNILANGKSLKSVCWASNGQPLIATYEGGGRGRLIIHCGFTSFFSTYWTDAGVRRLAVNSAAWLSGIDRPVSQ